jgi:drug/metabolite transporter (DMT)-like permease
VILPLAHASPASDPLRGIFFKASATFGIAAVSALVKVLSPHYPLGEIVFCRSFFMVIPVLVMVAMDPRGLSLLKTKRPFAHLRRSTSGMVGIVTSFLAVRYLPLADATALTFSSPLFLLAMAILVVGEQVGPYRSAAVLAGFAGVLLIAMPHVGESSPGGHALLGFVFGITAAVAIAFVQLALRALRDEPAATTVFYFTLIVTLTSGLTLPFAFRWPDNWQDAVLLLMTGVVGGLTQLMLTQSYRHADATALAPYDYLQLVWAMIIGYVLFGEAPAALVIMGAIVIAGAGVFIGMRERALAKRGPAPTLAIGTLDQGPLALAAVSLEPERRVRDEGIARALLAEGGGRAVTGQKGDVIAEGKELLPDGGNERAVIAPGEVGAPDRAAKDHIADDREARGRVIEDDMARRVAGAVNDVETDPPDGDGVAVGEPAIRDKDPGLSKPE